MNACYAKEASSLKTLVCEYSRFGSLPVRAVAGPNVDSLVGELSELHDWTGEGARAIVQLVNDYGTFMLRNALALAIVLEKEDGDLGF